MYRYGIKIIKHFLYYYYYRKLKRNNRIKGDMNFISENEIYPTQEYRQESWLQDGE